MVVAHGLYANACFKGEEFITTTYDIATDHFGWMLAFWNLAGVPFSYCFSSLFILSNGCFNHSLLYDTALFVLLLVAYYIWDTANMQKNVFRANQMGKTWTRRKFAWPTFDYGNIKNPNYLKDGNGTLFLDGWYKYARKPHYAADVIMAAVWGLATGVEAFWPYWYVLFFAPFLIHRTLRDEARCKKKYGELWKRYEKKVPYRFLPRIA